MVSKPDPTPEEFEALAVAPHDGESYAALIDAYRRLREERDNALTALAGTEEGLRNVRADVETQRLLATQEVADNDAEEAKLRAEVERLKHPRCVCGRVHDE